MNTAELFAEGMLEIKKNHKNSIARIDALLDLHIRIAENQPISVTVFNDEWKHLPSPILEDFIIQRKHYRKHFINILKDGMKKDLVVRMEEKTAFNLIINSVKWLHYTHKPLSFSDLEKRRKEIKTFVAKGLQINTL